VIPLNARETLEFRIIFQAAAYTQFDIDTKTVRNYRDDLIFNRGSSLLICLS